LFSRAYSSFGRALDEEIAAGGKAVDSVLHREKEPEKQQQIKEA
jgi:hypothetical protein